MTRAAALLAALALVLAGCGAPSAEDVLAETASNLNEIESGTLSLRFVAAAEGEEEGEAGFELEGPFALARDGGLPVAEMEYTKIAGEETATATFISTGETAYVRVGDVTYELPEEQQEELRAAGTGIETEAASELRVDDWVQGAEVSDGGRVGDAETDRVTGRLDVVSAVNDLLELARELGAYDGERIEGEDAEQLARAVESASVEVYTGKEDRLLRRLAIQVDFRAPSDLPPELRDLLNAAVAFELAIANPNEPVSVAEPEDAQPLPGE